MDGQARPRRFPKPDRFGSKRVQIRKQQDAQSVVGWAVTNFSELCDWIPAGNRRPGSQSDNLHKIRMTYSSEYEQFAQRLALCKMTEKNWPIGGPMRKTVHLLGRCWVSSRESFGNRSECEWPPSSEAGHASRGQKGREARWLRAFWAFAASGRLLLRERSRQHGEPRFSESVTGCSWIFRAFSGLCHRFSI